MEKKKTKAGMGVMTLSLLNVAAVLSIVNFPEQAEYGYKIIFYVSASALFFFIPTALVSAELASMLDRDGGIYLWVREAFGVKWGFIAVFMQWMNSLPWFATVLTFISTALAYMISPALADNRLFVYCTIVASMWICTVVNFRGIKTYARLSSIGVMLGTILPGVFMIALACVFLLSGHAPAIQPSVRAFLPSLDNLTQWMLLAGMMVALAGIDMPAVHVRDVENPGKNFPLAILISSVIIILLSIFGSLSISLIVPPEKLSMASGAPEAFEKMLSAFGLGYLTPLVCLMLIIGALTTVVTWTLGPSKGLLEVAKEGYLPPFWQYRNKHNIPVRILCVQAAVPCVISLVVFFMPTIGGAFWVMMALSGQLYMMMYLLVFAGAVRLRFTRPDAPRPYKIPFGNTGMIIAAGAGFVTSLAALAAGFIPPESIRSKGGWHSFGYVMFLLIATVSLITLVTLLCAYRERMLKKGGRPAGDA